MRKSPLKGLKSWPVWVALSLVAAVFLFQQVSRQRWFEASGQARGDERALGDLASYSLLLAKKNGAPPELVTLASVVEDSDKLAKANAGRLNTTSALMEPRMRLERARDVHADLPFAYWIHGPWLVFAAPGPDKVFSLAEPTLFVDETSVEMWELRDRFAFDPPTARGRGATFCASRSGRNSAMVVFRWLVRCLAIAAGALAALFIIAMILLLASGGRAAGIPHVQPAFVERGTAPASPHSPLPPPSAPTQVAPSP